VANELVKQIYEQNSATQVWICTGPTEDTTYSTYALIDKENNGRVPIGRPVACSQVSPEAVALVHEGEQLSYAAPAVG
jgi:non-ribosomal peptide synthetase component F